jgi:foldase protein PrsA
MKTSRSILALGAFFVVIALLVAGCGGSGVPSGDVAVMAGNPISQRAFDHWMYIAAEGEAEEDPGQPVIVPEDPPNFTHCIAQVKADLPTLRKTATKTLRADCQQLFTSLSSQVMDFLIKAYWYQADAYKLGIKLTPAQINTALAAAKKSEFSNATQYQEFLKESGQTANDILFRVRVNQIYTKLTARHPTTVTSAMISNYYNAHKSQFGTAESRNMRIVLAKSAASAQAAKSALQSGQSWTTVAKKYSTDPTTKNSGGLLSNVTPGQQDAALSKAAFAAPLNKLEGPVKGQFGYYVVQVIKITPATQKTLAQSTKLIKQTLASQLATDAQNAVNSQAEKNWKSKTKCAAPYAMADCSGYKAPKSSSSTTTSSASG